MSEAKNISAKAALAGGPTTLGGRIMASNDAIFAAALGVVMMAPALGVYANLSLVFSSAGNAAPLVLLLALALTLPTALSYAMVSREVPSTTGRM